MIRWSPTAAADLEEICAHIARDSEPYASLFAKRVMAAVRSLERFPKLGRVVPEYRDEDIREVFCLAYRVVYRLKPGAIEIAKIRHGARLLR